MSAYQVRVLVLVLVGLFAWCALYARILATHPEWYLPNNKTWVTVLLGFVWILAALAVLVYLGLFDLADLGIVILCCAAAGAPIIVWQYLQDGRQRAIRDARRRRERNSGDGNGAEN